VVVREYDRRLAKRTRDISGSAQVRPALPHQVAFNRRAQAVVGLELRSTSPTAL
jgi:hypothetical protein